MKMCPIFHFEPKAS